MKMKFALAVGVLAVAFNASALLIGPGNATYQDNAVYPNNPDADDVETITGCANLTILYKQDQGAGTDSGTFASSYNTTFDNTPDDPMDADVVNNGPGSIAPQASCLWLLVKDGNHDPIWYLINLSASGLNWNGTDTLQLRNFWPGGGAISHVTIFGGDTPNVPDGGATVMLLGAALTGLGVVRRFLKA